LFAKMNHAAADLKTRNESAFQRRGITGCLMVFVMQHGSLAERLSINAPAAPANSEHGLGRI
jgi:hypothetical protein